MIGFGQGKPWATHCRCGAPLSFSCEDVKEGRPAEGADYWCSDGSEATGPHDWGVVVYRREEMKPKGYQAVVAR